MVRAGERELTRSPRCCVLRACRERTSHKDGVAEADRQSHSPYATTGSPPSLRRACVSALPTSLTVRSSSCNQPFSLTPTPGDSLLGSQRLSAALGTYYASHLLPLTPVLPSHIATANGLTHLLDQLSAVLCDAGEAFILPTPFYNAFPEDFGRRSGVRIVGVEIGEWLEGSLGEVKALEAEMRRRKGTGEPAVRAVVVTNPSNPLGEWENFVGGEQRGADRAIFAGFCYDKDVLLEYARFAERWNVYLIVDEIYAQSVYSSGTSRAPPPQSSLILRRPGLPNLVHLHPLSRRPLRSRTHHPALRHVQRLWRQRLPHRRRCHPAQPTPLRRPLRDRRDLHEDRFSRRTSPFSSQHRH